MRISCYLFNFFIHIVVSSWRMNISMVHSLSLRILQQAEHPDSGHVLNASLLRIPKPLDCDLFPATRFFVKNDVAFCTGENVQQAADVLTSVVGSALAQQL